MSLNKILGTLGFLVLAVATWITLSGQPIANRINTWQANMMGDNKYFPALTIFMIALPPLVLLALVKLVMMRKSTKRY